MTPNQKELINRVWGYNKKQLKDRFQYLLLKRMKIDMYVIKSKKISFTTVFYMPPSQEELEELEQMETLIPISGNKKFYANIITSICSSTTNPYITKDIKQKLRCINGINEIVISIASPNSDCYQTVYRGYLKPAKFIG